MALNKVSSTNNINNMQLMPTNSPRQRSRSTSLRRDRIRQRRWNSTKPVEELTVKDHDCAKGRMKIDDRLDFENLLKEEGGRRDVCLDVNVRLDDDGAVSGEGMKFVRRNTNPSRTTTMAQQQLKEKQHMKINNNARRRTLSPKGKQQQSPTAAIQSSSPRQQETSQNNLKFSMPDEYNKHSQRHRNSNRTPRSHRRSLSSRPSPHHSRTSSTPPSSKPSLHRITSAPTQSSSPIINSLSTNIMDQSLRERASRIRSTLRQAELSELAIEAERAADSGMERFVGSASKFLEDDFVLSSGSVVSNSNTLVVQQIECNVGNCVDVGNYHHPYLNNLYRKKIRVTSLREIHSVIPRFEGMHDHIRGHLEVRGVNPDLLQEVKDDEHTYAEDGSIASTFSSFALGSLRDVMDYVGAKKYDKKNKNSGDKKKRHLTSPHNKNLDKKNLLKDNKYNSFERISSSRNTRKSNIIKSSTGASTKITFTETNYNSDDSSVELYARRETDGRASPSSVNGVLSGENESLPPNSTRNKVMFVLNDHEKDEPSILTPSVATEATSTVASFFTRMQRKFTTDKRKNEQFIQNFFYTQDYSNDMLHNNYNSKIDINPDTHKEKRDGFCTSHCQHYTSCESVGKGMDMVLNWFNEGYCSEVPSSMSVHTRNNAELHYPWMRTWNHGGGRKFFPPRLGGDG